jgi:hypothetical protein
VEGGSSPYQYGGGGEGDGVGGIDTDSPILTCRHLRDAVPASFVADPFLIRREARPSSSSSGKEWFLFFEYKNLDRFTGEIGVASSGDGGRTWTFLGTALREPFHLS